MIEEYARFVLDDEKLSARAKTIRHRLCEAMTGFDSAVLIGARDSENDVGQSRVVAGQIERREVFDCVTAAFKRLSEALRSLYEYGEVAGAGKGAVFEALRFEGYTLEKDLVCAAGTRGRFAKVGLYVLVNAGPDTKAEDVLAMVRACADGGADCIQLRAKGLGDRALLELARRVFDACREEDVVGILNDRADIADLAGADGVHLGQEDLRADEVRQVVRREMVVGVSTHNGDELAEAIGQKPTYVGLGAVFASKTKPSVDVAGLEYVRYAREKLDGTGIYSVGIGGITENNAGSVIEAGADAVAVSAGITQSSSPEEMCRLYKEAITRRRVE